MMQCDLVSFTRRLCVVLDPRRISVEAEICTRCCGKECSLRGLVGRYGGGYGLGLSPVSSGRASR